MNPIDQFNNTAIGWRSRSMFLSVIGLWKQREFFKYFGKVWMHGGFLFYVYKLYAYFVNKLIGIFIQKVQRIKFPN